MKKLIENLDLLKLGMIVLAIIFLCMLIAAGLKLMTDHSPKVEVGTYCQTYAQELKDPSGCKFIVVSDCHGIAIVHSPKCPNH